MYNYAFDTDNKNLVNSAAGTSRLNIENMFDFVNTV